MKKFILAGLSVLILSAQATAQKSSISMQSQKDSASYAFGMMVAQSLLRQMSEDLNYDLVAEGLRAGLKGESSVMSAETAMGIFTNYTQAAKMKAGEAARVEGERFLAENGKRKEVATTPSGLQYEVLKKGTGTASPAATDKVTVHYHGTLVNGEVFDSSVERGEPATFGLNQVIRGWTEGVQLMKVGDKFRFFLPYQLAYGENGAGAKIKPYSALIFDVELLDIKK